MPSDHDTPWTYAEELLALCQDLLEGAVDDTVAQHPGGEIDRAYVWFGQAPVDCEQVTVSWSGFGEAPSAGLPTLLKHVYGRVNLVTFTIRVVRDCVPTLKGKAPPSVESSEASARELVRDAWALWSGIYQTMKAGDLFGGRCSGLQMVNASPLEPMGNLAGFDLVIATEIDGIIAASGS